MSRGLIYDDVTDSDGNAQVGVQVGVFVSDGLYTTYAPLWDAAVGGNAVANPLTTVTRGIYTAFAEAGEYDVRVTTGAGSYDRPQFPVFDADDIAAIASSVSAASTSAGEASTSADEAAASAVEAAKVTPYPSIVELKAAVGYVVGKYASAWRNGVLTNFKAIAAGGADEYGQLAGVGVDWKIVPVNNSSNIQSYGAASGGVVDCSAELVAALQSGIKTLYISDTIALASNVSATLTGDLEIRGGGKIIYTGATDNTLPLVAIETAGFSFTHSGVGFDGDNKIPLGLRVYNSEEPDSNTLPTCAINKSLFIRFRMNVTGIWNDAVYIAGTFGLVDIRGNKVRLITRAAGTGTPSSTGTAGITVTWLSATKYVRSCLHNGNEYTGIYGDDLIGSSNNVDHDAFRFFAPSPALLAGKYSDSHAETWGNTYRNCRGRAVKIQSVGSAHDETIIRDDGYSNFGGSVEINMQYGVGSVSNIKCYYRQNGDFSSPIQSGLSIVGFYQGSDYGEKTASVIVNDIQIFNSIPEGVGTNISSFVSVTNGGGAVAVPYKPLVSISNATVNANVIDWLVTTGYTVDTYGTMRLDNISVPKLTYGAVLSNGVDNNFDIVATNIVNLDGVQTPANRKPFVTDGAGAAIVYGGELLGGMNQGFLNSYANSSSVNKAPMFLGGALSDEGGVGGAASTQAAFIADDGVHEFDMRFMTTSRGMFFVSINYEYTSQGIFSTGSNQVHVMAQPAGSIFETSVFGTNPDVDGKFNLWYTGSKLNVKNRLGAGYTATIMFLG
jgi:hypothetical protein